MSFFRYVLSGTFSISAFILTLGFTTLQPSKAEIKTRAKRIPRIAIIGSGIGGSATAHFIREILGENAQISVFEKAERVGGRLATLDFAGDTFEAGGSIIHPNNLYMKRFLKELGLEMKTSSGGQFSLYDSENIVFSTSSWLWLTTVKLLWRYGYSLIKMEKATKNLLKKFANIYTLQENGELFSTVPDMLKAMSGDEELHRLTQISTREYLTEQGLSDLLINELVTAVTRINYGQSTEVNAFTGMTSLAGAEPNLWSVREGNWKVCEGLLKKSQAILNKNTQIIEIIKKPSDDDRPLYYLRSVETLISTPFDVVILALPLEVGQNFIGCSECEKWPAKNELGKFQQTVATFVNGTPNEDTFRTQSKTVGTMEKPDIFFSSIGKQSSVYKDKASETQAPSNVWKVFSRKPLTNQQKEKLFSQATDSKEVIWLAYPHYTPPEKFLPFVLDEGVFYVNAIEWVASAMEMSSLAAKNAALLTGKYFNKTKSVSQESGDVHGEL